MADVLDLDLNSFDLEDIMTTSSTPQYNAGGNSGNNNMGATKSISISSSPANSRPASVPMQMQSLGSGSANASRSASQAGGGMGLDLGDTFGLEMLANPKKVDGVSSPTNLNNSNNSAKPPNTNSGGGMFGNLFGNSKPANNSPPNQPSKSLFGGGSGNGNNANGGGFGLGGGSLDLDKELADLDAGLNANMNKAANLGASNFNRPNTSMSTSMGVAGGNGGGGLGDNMGMNGSFSMTYEEQQTEKFKLLQKFERLRKKGVKVHKVFSMSSDYDEMKNEYESLENQRRIDLSVKMQRSWLLNAVNGIEYLNGTFDPFDIRLDGWGESLNEDLLKGDYDDIFEELYEKYKGYGNYPPEVRLIMGVAGSAFAFHIQNRITSNLDFDSNRILRENPDIARQMQEAAQKSASQQMPGMSKFMGMFNGGGGGGSSGDSGPPPFPGMGGRPSDIPDLNTVLNS